MIAPPWRAWRRCLPSRTFREPRRAHPCARATKRERKNRCCFCTRLTPTNTLQLHHCPLPQTQDLAGPAREGQEADRWRREGGEVLPHLLFGLRSVVWLLWPRRSPRRERRAARRSIAAVGHAGRGGPVPRRCHRGSPAADGERLLAEGPAARLSYDHSPSPPGRAVRRDRHDCELLPAARPQRSSFVVQRRVPLLLGDPFVLLCPAPSPSSYI